MNLIFKLPLILIVFLACSACSSQKEISRRADLEQRAEEQKARAKSLEDRDKKNSERRKRIEGKTPYEKTRDQILEDQLDYKIHIWSREALEDK